MYCKNCGVKLRGGSLYCDKCGSKVDVEDPRIPLIDLVDFGIDEADDTIPERVNENGNALSVPVSRRWNALPMFFSVVSLICVMALCASVLAYAITYDVRTKKASRASNLGAENYTAYKAEDEYTRPAETQAPTDKDNELADASESEEGQATTSVPESSSASEAAALTTTSAAEMSEAENDSSAVTTTTADSSQASDEPETEIDPDKLYEPAVERFIDIMYVDTVQGALFLRNGPGYEYGFVNYTGIPAGEEADIYAQQYSDEYDELWLYVNCDGCKGWATMSALTHVKPYEPDDSEYLYFTAKVLSGGARAYSGAGTFYDKVFTVPAGKYVSIYDFSDDMDWLYVAYNGEKGWISSEAVGY